MNTTKAVAIAALLLASLAASAEEPIHGANDKLYRLKLDELSAVEAASLIKSGQLSAMKLTRAVIANASRHQHLNAYITLDEKGALRQAALVDQRIAAGTAAGRLLGVPLVIKDNIEVADLPITIGTPAMQDIIPQQHAAVVQALVDDGAIILGKANLHELAVGVTSTNAYFGAVGNPHRADFFAGGSSGGTAAAIASRSAIAGLGSDTGGSIRIPAALTGICGLRPSTTRYPERGVVPLSKSRDTTGPMARNITDLVLLDAVIMGHEPDYRPADIPGIRLGVPRSYFYAYLEAGVAEVIEKTLQKIAKAGITLVEVDMDLPANIEDSIGFPLVSHEIREELPAYLQARTAGRPGYTELVAGIASPDVKTIFETLFVGPETQDAIKEYRHIKQVVLPKFQASYQDYFDNSDLDAMIFPTTPLTAKSIKDVRETMEINGETVSTFKLFSRNTAPGSIAGIPGITLPIGMSPVDGLPVGIAIDGPVNSDQRLLSIALTLEEIIGPLSPPHRRENPHLN